MSRKSCSERRGFLTASWSADTGNSTTYGWAADAAASTPGKSSSDGGGSTIGVCGPQVVQQLVVRRFLHFRFYMIIAPLLQYLADKEQ